MKRLLSPLTNAAGLTAAGMACYAAAVMIANAVHHHGIIDVPVVVAAISSVAALYTRQQVTPVSDPVDGAGRPLAPAEKPAGNMPADIPSAIPGAHP